MSVWTKPFSSVFSKVFRGSWGNSSETQGLSVSLSSSTGVAPLYVSFDATDSPAFATDGFVQSTCLWNFDVDNVDASAPHKTGNGFVSGHVFRNPGTYKVRLDGYTKAGVKHTIDKTVTVSAFSGTTYYVSAAGSDANPGTQALPFLNAKYAFDTVLQAGSNTNNVRILFRTGDTFPIPGSQTWYYDTCNGTIIIGSYSEGSGVKPILFSQASGGSSWEMLQMGSGWRVMDVQMQSGGWTPASQSGYPGPFTYKETSSNTLMYRVDMSNLGNFTFNVQGQTNAMVDCTSNHTSGGGYSYAVVNDSCALIGCTMTDLSTANRQHAFRLQGGTRWYIAENNIDGLGANYDMVTIRGDSSKIVIWKNTVNGLLSVQPQNGGALPVEIQTDVLLDSNSFIRKAGGFAYSTETALILSCQRTLARNNITNDFVQAISIGGPGASGEPANIWIYNNTMNPATVDYGSGITVQSAQPTIDIKNNAFWDSSTIADYRRQYIQYTGGTPEYAGTSNYGAVGGLNWGVNQAAYDDKSLTAWRALKGDDVNTIRLVANPFDSLDPVNVGFVKPSVGSPVLGAGTFVGTITDNKGNLRSTTTPTIGAIES